MTRHDYYVAIHKATKRKNRFRLDKHGALWWRGPSPPDVWIEGPAMLSHDDDRLISDAANNRQGCDPVIRETLLAACRIEQ